MRTPTQNALGNALPDTSGRGSNATGERDAYRHDPGNPRLQAEIGSIQGENPADEDDIPQTAATDQRITRSKWPRDPQKRRIELARTLPQALREYYGNVRVIAAKFGLPEAEIRAEIDADPDLAAQEKYHQDTANALLEDKLLQLALTGDSGTDCRYLLERRMPETYAKKPAQTGPKRNLDLPLQDPGSVLDAAKPKAQ